MGGTTEEDGESSTYEEVEVTRELLKDSVNITEMPLSLCKHVQSMLHINFQMSILEWDIFLTQFRTMIHHCKRL